MVSSIILVISNGLRWRDPPTEYSAHKTVYNRFIRWNIRLGVMIYVRFPLSLRNVEYLLFERGIDICHETVRFWWNRFGPLFAGDIRRQRVSRMKGFRQWRWHLDEIYVKLNGEMVYLWRTVDQEGELLESFVTRKREKDAALTFMKKALKRHGSPEKITTDGVRSFKALATQLCCP